MAADAFAEMNFRSACYSAYTLSAAKNQRVVPPKHSSGRPNHSCPSRRIQSQNPSPESGDRSLPLANIALREGTSQADLLLSHLWVPEQGRTDWKGFNRIQLWILIILWTTTVKTYYKCQVQNGQHKQGGTSHWVTNKITPVTFLSLFQIFQGFKKIKPNYCNPLLLFI